MKLAYLTAGAGSMYCGSCMRDNTLAAALIRQKRDVTLIPVYSPIRTDEPDVSSKQVFYGGINIYLQQKAAIFRRWRFLDRLLDAPGILRRVIRGPDGANMDDVGALTVSILRGHWGAQLRELDKLVDGLRELRPDVVHLPDVLFVGLAPRLRDKLGVRIACTLTGEDIFLDTLPRPYQIEATALIREQATEVDAYIAPTRYYGNYAREQFAIPQDRLHHVPIGIRLDDTRAINKTHTASSPVIGFLARICPEKGLHVLAEAFRLLHARGRKCQLKIAGYLPPARRKYLENIISQLHNAGLSQFVTHAGELSRNQKLAFLAECDIVSVPTVYREAKGIYVLEALAQGVPVVQPRHGSFPELIDDTAGGLLVEPNNPESLADGLDQLLVDPELRRQMGQRGRQKVHEAYTDDKMAAAAWRVFESIQVAQ